MRKMLASALALAMAAHAAPVSAQEAEEAQEAQEEPHSRFYWHEALGLGVIGGVSSYDTGTRGFTTFSIDSVSTFAARLARSVALGGSLDFHFIGPSTVVEERSLGHKEISVPFGVAGSVGPALVVMPGPFRFETSPGFFWIVLAHGENGGGGASLGGTGFGGNVAGAYDIPLGERVMLGFEGRLLAGVYFNSDPTHTLGWTMAGTLLVALHAR